ncbi:unnamed protein product [Penicillium discolor]
MSDIDSDLLDLHQNNSGEMAEVALEEAGGDPSGWPPPEWSPQLSLDNMKENGIQKAILSLTAPGATIAATDQEARHLACKANEYAAGLRDRHPDKFGFFASLPSLMDIEGALTEIHYAMDILNADGVTLFTRYGDGNNYWGHSAELDKHKAVTFIHPTHPVDLARVNQLLPQPSIDYPQETTRTAVDMIITNVTQRFSNCVKILSHAGGTLPFLVSRISVTSQETEDTKKTYGTTYGKTYADIMDDLRSFHYDVALSSSPAVMKLLLELVPHDYITCGSDFPYAASDKIAGFRERLDGFSMTKRLREMIYFNNALGFI